MIIKKYIIVIIAFGCMIYNVCTDNEFCTLSTEDNTCSVSSQNYRYILYDVNPAEGFNLRRDVYMRLAVFVHKLNKLKLKLVLPPWSDLYHWTNVASDTHIPWSQFFDLASLQLFAPVIEMYQFFNEVGRNYEKVSIDEVYILQNFPDMFETGNFQDRFGVEPCQKEKNVNFYYYDNLTSNSIRCLSFHGRASQLVDILENSQSKTFLFDHAEIVLHDSYGDRIYWAARRSMRFNLKLRSIANDFRRSNLNSTDQLDNTILSDQWTQEKARRDARGGPYICAHLRRRDFIWGRASEVPDLDSAAQLLEQVLVKYNLATVFIATDAPQQEYEELKAKLSKNYKVLKYRPEADVIRKYGDGGIAIIDQIICSHAYYFIGTHESTFSFRIQEEREILGFPADRTFNRFCGNANATCEKPSQWKIVF